MSKFDRAKFNARHHAMAEVLAAKPTIELTPSRVSVHASAAASANSVPALRAEVAGLANEVAMLAVVVNEMLNSEGV
jgi:hypothetical protein